MLNRGLPNFQPIQTPPYPHPPNPDQGLLSALALYFARPIGLRANCKHPPLLSKISPPGGKKNLQIVEGSG